MSKHGRNVGNTFYINIQLNYLHISVTSIRFLFCWRFCKFGAYFVTEKSCQRSNLKSGRVRQRKEQLKVGNDAVDFETDESFVVFDIDPC